MKTLRYWAIPIFISLYFLALTARAVYTYFSPDDVMNIYQSWYEPSIVPIIKANLLFFQPSLWSRPLAQLWLRLIFDAAGFHPVPFKVANLVILVANLFLTYSLALRLAGSRTAAGLTALLIAYHGKAADLYFNTAYVFDVLCYFFYFAAALIYVRARQDRARHDRRFPTISALLSILLLYICALNSKELAVTFPVFLLLYELIYHGPRGDYLRRSIAILATGIITIAAIFGRILHGSLIQESAYQSTFTVAQFMRTSIDFAGNLFCNPGAVKPATLLTVWIAMLAIAWLSRSKPLRFAWLFLMLAPLPVAFIDPRGLPQYYIPLFGWALYAGALIDLALVRILNRVNPANPIRARIYSSAALFIGLALILYPVWRNYHPYEPTAVMIEAEQNRSIVRQLHRLAPNLPSHDSIQRPHILFLDDPVRPDWSNLQFITRLSYRDRTIEVDRAKVGMAPPTPDQLASYDKVFDYRDGYFYLLTAPWRRETKPVVLIEWGRPQIFHRDWSLVNRDRPAHPDEVVIIKATELGETIPHLEPGGKFPAAPAATVLSPVHVRVITLPAPVLSKTGWPNESTYRVTIRIPPNTPHGLVWIDVTTNGVTGPAVEFPVR